MGSLSDSSSLRTENNRIRLSPNNLEGIKIENPNAERESGNLLPTKRIGRGVKEAEVELGMEVVVTFL